MLYLLPVKSVCEHVLLDINAVVEDEFIGVILFSSLPEEYKPMIMAPESLGTKIISELM
jgi:hypothetical protein